MVVRNQKALNACSYNKIYIDDNVNVYKTKKSRLETILTTKFTDSLKGLSDIEKKTEIVRYFLRNNRICSVRFLKDKFEYVDNIGITYKEYLVVQSLNGKTLRIKKEDVSDELLKEIYFKYECDRVDYFANNEFDVYSFEAFSDKEYYMTIPQDTFMGIVPSEFIGKRELCLYITMVEGKISDIDKSILESMFDIGELITQYRFLSSYGYYFKTNDGRYKYVNVGDDLDAKIFNPMLREREKKKKEEKTKQIRMEEFK